MIYKSIFIDLDDTLWDTYHNNKECLEELYTDYHFNRYYELLSLRADKSNLMFD